MRIKSFLLALSSFLLPITFIACDDDLNEIGAGIQPDGDGIEAILDTVDILSRTVSMNNSVYGITDMGLLGKFDDPLFGSIKSDYLTEFYCPTDSLIFNEGTGFMGIDSVKMRIVFTKFSGDSIAPMGVSVYRVTSQLKRDYFTDVDPTQFSDMEKMLGQKTYTVSQAEKIKSGGILYRRLNVDFDKKIGEDFYNEWKNGNGFKNTNELRKYFPGLYITTTFGSGSLVEAEATSINVYYKYKDSVKDTLRNESGNPILGEDGQAIIGHVRDTVINSIFSIVSTPQIITLNSVRNTFPDPNPLLTDPNALYIKAPAGVYPEMQLQLKEIVAKMNSYTDERLSVNSAKFVIKGYTEREQEQEYKFGKAPYLLLIDQDSLSNFFMKNSPLPDNKTSFVAAWNSNTNSYSFNSLAPMIIAYRDKFNNGLTEEPTFALIPIRATFANQSTSSPVLISVFNYMSPATSIIRKDKENLQFSYILSKY